jgi:predicted ATP-grasp superfamily ATP-dependent carboligase
MKRRSILVLDGGSSQALPIIRSLYKSGHHISLVIPHRFCSGFFSRFAHNKIVIKRTADSKGLTLQWLISYLSSNRTDLVLGLSDSTAKLLSVNKKQLSKYTKIIVPDHDIFFTASDKLNTMRFCMEQSIPSPYTVDGENIDINSIELQLKFPVIIKPTVGVGSKGVYKYNNPIDLKRDFAAKTNTYGHLIIQEFIPNEDQYTIEAFCDKNSQLKACVVVAKSRYYPVSGGTSSCNLSVKSTAIENVVREFLYKLKWVGSANLDVILDRRDNTPKIIEINPRTGAMIRIAFEAGVNIADLTMQLAFEDKVKDCLDYKENIILRNLMLEFFWFFSSPLRKWLTTKPSFFIFFRKNVFFENVRLDDPFTGIGYVLGLLKKFSNIDQFREKIEARQ